MRQRDLRLLVAAAWVVSAVASLASINFSGVPPLGWYGMGFVPCDLCWYQRLLMYPLPLLLGLAWSRMERVLLVAALAMSSLGTAVAAYHSLVEIDPALEVGSCSLVTCSVSPWRLGPLTIPNLSLIAFTAITALLATVAWLGRRKAKATGADGDADDSTAQD